MARVSPRFSSFPFDKYFCEIEFNSIRITRHVSRCVILPAWLEFRIVGRLRVYLWKYRTEVVSPLPAQLAANLQLCRVSQDVRNRSFDSVKKRQGKSYASPPFDHARADRFSSLGRGILIVCYLFDYLVNASRMKRGARGSWKCWKCECAFRRRIFVRRFPFPRKFRQVDTSASGRFQLSLNCEIVV